MTSYYVIIDHLMCKNLLKNTTKINFWRKTWIKFFMKDYS